LGTFGPSSKLAKFYEIFYLKYLTSQQFFSNARLEAVALMARYPGTNCVKFSILHEITGENSKDKIMNDEYTFPNGFGEELRALMEWVYLLQSLNGEKGKNFLELILILFFFKFFFVID
jgi:hypothetical protein